MRQEVKDLKRKNIVLKAYLEVNVKRNDQIQAKLSNTERQVMHMTAQMTSTVPLVFKPADALFFQEIVCNCRADQRTHCQHHPTDKIAHLPWIA